MQRESQKNRFACFSFGNIQFLPPFIWDLPFMSSYQLWWVSSVAWSSGILNFFRVRWIIVSDVILSDRIRFPGIKNLLKMSLKMYISGYKHALCTFFLKFYIIHPEIWKARIQTWNALRTHSWCSIWMDICLPKPAQPYTLLDGSGKVFGSST